MTAWRSEIRRLGGPRRLRGVGASAVGRFADRPVIECRLRWCRRAGAGGVPQSLQGQEECRVLPWHICLPPPTDQGGTKRICSRPRGVPLSPTTTGGRHAGRRHALLVPNDTRLGQGRVQDRRQTLRAKGTSNSGSRERRPSSVKRGRLARPMLCPRCRRRRRCQVASSAALAAAAMVLPPLFNPDGSRLADPRDPPVQCRDDRRPQPALTPRRPGSGSLPGADAEPRHHDEKTKGRCRSAFAAGPS